jgi:hypothetical protein
MPNRVSARRRTMVNALLLFTAIVALYLLLALLAW